MISDLSIDFQMVKNEGFKKASLYVYFEGLTTDFYSAKQDSLGRGHIENGLFYTLLMRKHDFSPFHWFLKGQKWGLKKLLSMSILKVWQLTLILAKQDPVEGGHIEKWLFYTLLMRKHDFWPFHWFLNGQKWGVKKVSLHVYFEGLTPNSYTAKEDSLGRGHIEKWAFLHSSDEKTWFLTFPLIFKWSKMRG